MHTHIHANKFYPLPGYYVNNEDPENPSEGDEAVEDGVDIASPVKTIERKHLGRVIRDIEDKKVIVTRYPIDWD